MQRNDCPYCGANPVPHFLNWYFESLNILFTPVRAVFLYNPLVKATKKILHKLDISLWLTKTCLLFGILTEQKNIDECKVPRAKVLWEEARKRGIEFVELKLFGKSFDAYMASKTEEKSNKKQVTRTLVFSGLPRPKDYDDTALDTLDDKYQLKQKFLKANLPVPHGGSAWRFGQALKIFRKIAKPVIVKPRAGSRGRHSTTYVYTEQQLQQAFNIAKQLCFWVIIEEHITGPVYRATVIDYTLRGVLRGDSPQVVGDGQSNIAELVKRKNTQPHPGIKDIQLDAKSVLFLQRQKLMVNSVPVSGQVVTLSEKIGVNYGGSSSEDLGICHADNKKLFERAAVTAGDPIVGFDYIIPDITKSYREQKTGFIEANSLPFINLHHDPFAGHPSNVAKYVWELVSF